LSIPNLITLGRIILVPAVVWAIISGEMLVAFALFLVAGISDAVDGFLAKRFHMASELGAYLDPLADKALIVSIYVALGIAGALPISLVILVVSRDIMIVSGFMLSWLIGKPMPVRPLAISKVNTVAQIFLATFVLAEQGFRFNSALSAIVVRWSPSRPCFRSPLSRRMGPAYELVRRRIDRPLLRSRFHWRCPQFGAEQLPQDLSSFLASSKAHRLTGRPASGTHKAGDSS
jgi:cardiolipin synthase